MVTIYEEDKNMKMLNEKNQIITAKYSFFTCIFSVTAACDLLEPFVWPSHGAIEESMAV